MDRTSSRVALLLAALLVALLTSACGGSDGDGGSKPAKEASEGSAEVDDPAAPGGSSATPKLRLVQVGTFESPVNAVAVPGTDLVAVVEKTGRVRIASGMSCSTATTCPKRPVTEGDTVIDVSSNLSSGSEQGLLGLAFHPKWPSDPRVFINFTDRDGDTHVEAWTLQSPTARAKKLGELLRIDQPYDNHNGGHLAFGPDGLLYVGTGDGGSGGDPEDRAQKADEVLGKLLRLDVDADPARGWAPAPGSVKGGPGEVWAVGLRNPWRFSFDSETGDLWIGDVGQDKFEEVDALAKAKLAPGETPNFGWRRREGFASFDSSGVTGPGTVIDPVFDYGRTDGCSVTGGVVYHGELVPDLEGWYLFADFCGDELRLVPDAAALVGKPHRRGEVTWRAVKGAPQVASIAQVQRGEVLLVSLDGSIRQVLPA